MVYFLNVSESTVRNLERDGELPALPRIGTRIIFFYPKIVRYKPVADGSVPLVRVGNTIRIPVRAAGAAGRRK